jgi:hypothetical protein
VSSFSLIPTTLVLGQDFEDEAIFKPLIQPTPTRKPTGPPPVFSFGRFEANFRALCEEMEIDGRREVLVAVATREASRKDEACISCRVLWRTVVSACAKLGPKPTPSPKLKPIKGTPTAAAEGATTDVVEGDAPTPSPIPTPLTPSVKNKPRAPSTTAVDIASRISSAAYEADSGEGGVIVAFRNMVAMVMRSKELTAAEREYYDILFTFMMAAWEGRSGPDGQVHSTPEVSADEFFEE